MPKYGSKDVALILVDGYDLISSKVKGLASKTEAPQERSEGLGDAWEEHTPTGLKRAMLTQDGAFFDDGTNRIHTAMASQVAVSRIVCYGVEGNTIGKRFVGLAGAYTLSYEVLAQLGGLTKANVVHEVTGQKDEGRILQKLEAKTVDWNTEGADSVDNGASSAAGGVGYQQVTALSGFTGFVGKIRHSADDITYADLITFANVTAAPAKERLTVSGTVNRHLAFNGDVTVTGSITIFAGFARN